MEPVFFVIAFGVAYTSVEVTDAVEYEASLVFCGGSVDNEVSRIKNSVTLFSVGEESVSKNKAERHKDGTPKEGLSYVLRGEQAA